MNKILAMFAAMIIVGASAIGQTHNQSSGHQRIEVSVSKTSNIIFAHPILSVDRGSKEVLAQKAKGVDNILLVKAASKFSHETNLTVVTADGQVRAFAVIYRDTPVHTSISASSTALGDMRLAPDQYNQTILAEKAGLAAISKRKVGNILDSGNGITFTIDGLFVHENAIFVRVHIVNRSAIQYDIDQLRFFIQDLKGAKRTTLQDLEVRPVHIHNFINVIPGKMQSVMVFALPKFTIPDRKVFRVQLIERNGGRNFSLKITNRKFMAAQPI